MTTAKRSWEEQETLENTYLGVFKSYSDAQFKNACQLYMAEGEFFPPRPKELMRYLDDKDSKHDRELAEMWTCALCKQKVTAISNGICLDCSGMMPVEADRIKLPVPMPRNYRMEGRMMCGKCGDVGLCIKENDEDHWLCQQCYTGLSKKEIAKRFRVLADVVAGNSNKFTEPVEEERIPF